MYWKILNYIHRILFKHMGYKMSNDALFKRLDGIEVFKKLDEMKMYPETKSELKLMLWEAEKRGYMQGWNKCKDVKHAILSKNIYNSITKGI